MFPSCEMYKCIGMDNKMTNIFPSQSFLSGFQSHKNLVTFYGHKCYTNSHLHLDIWPQRAKKKWSGTSPWSFALDVAVCQNSHVRTRTPQLQLPPQKGSCREDPHNFHVTKVSLEILKSTIFPAALPRGDEIPAYQFFLPPYSQLSNGFLLLVG